MYRTQNVFFFYFHLFIFYPRRLGQGVRFSAVCGADVDSPKNTYIKRKKENNNNTRDIQCDQGYAAPGNKRQTTKSERE